MDKPTLDAAQLDDMKSGPDRWYGWRDSEKSALLAQARLALAQSERIATLEAELAFLRDLPVDALKKQLEEMEEMSALNVRLGDILTLTVNALRGEPDSRSLHDWATLPEVARTLVAELASSRQDAQLAWAEAAMGPTEAAITHELAQSQAHANALRDALFSAERNFDVTAGQTTDDLARQACVRYRDEAARVLAQTPAASLASHDAEVLERAAKLMDDHYPDSRFDGHYRQAADLPPLTFGDAIRALAAQEVR